MKYILSFLFLFTGSLAAGQTIDRIRVQLDRTSNVKEKITLMADLIEAYQRVSTDTALIIGQEALKLYNHDSLTPQLLQLKTKLATVYLNRGEYSTADSIFQLTLEVAIKTGNMRQAALIYNNFGLSQSNQHNYNLAVELYLKSALLADSLKMFDLPIKILINIGNIYFYQGNSRKALDYHLQAIEKYKQYSVPTDATYATILRNTGAFYQSIDKVDSAYYYTNLSLELSRKLNDKKGMSICFQNLGEILLLEDSTKNKLQNQKIISLSSKTIAKVENYFLQSLKLKRELKNARGIAHTANSLGELNKIKGEYSLAIVFFNESILYAKSIRDYDILRAAYQELSATFDSMGNIDAALKNYKLSSAYQDTVAQKSGELKLLDLQTQYETSLKEKQILELKHQQNVNEIVIKNSRRVIVISLVAIVVIVILLFLVYRAFLSIKRKRDVLSEKNAIIEQQNEEITTQRDHLADSNMRIQFQHKQIEDSINYARQIQESLLPSDIIMQSSLGEYALFYLPKDVVSGDFYWVNQDSRYTYVAVGDCTGHGVPGAFMSVLSISLLNEIVKGKGIKNPSGILNEMRRLVIASLKQDGTKMGGTDGLELAICRIDKNTKQLVFAGAQRSLLILRNDEIEEYLPNKMPVSAHVMMFDFTEHEIETRTGDILYLFTDGFQDQFEAQNAHRYGKQRFKELLLSNINLTMAGQQKKLETEFSIWKGGNEQIDDVLVLGLRI